MFFRGAHPSCPVCKKPYARKSRGVIGKIFRVAAYHCNTCGRNLFYYRTPFTFLSVHAYCPRCRGYELSRLRKPDQIDPMSRNPARFLLYILRFPLYYCGLCRVQFADWRSRHPDYRRQGSKQAVS